MTTQAPSKAGRKRATAGKTAAAKPAASKRRPSGLSAATIRTMFERFRASEPEPKGELEHVNVFTLLVAVVLSAQATDAGVNKATRALFARITTPAQMVALGEERLIEHIKTIGLFRAKAKNVIKLSERLIADRCGEVPADRNYLESLPGVGRKTANVVMNMAFGQPTMAVDTHVFRVANRTGMAPGKDPLAVEAALLEVVPAEFGLHAHHWLILHGRYHCLARKPQCPTCIIKDLCAFDETTGEMTAAVTAAPRKPATARSKSKTSNAKRARAG